MKTKTYSGPTFDIGYDAVRNMYHGTLTSSRGQYNFEGPDYGSVMNALTRAYAQECEELARQIDKDEEKEKVSSVLKKKKGGPKLSLPIGGGEEPAMTLTGAAVGTVKIAFGVLDEILSFVPAKKFAICFGGVMIYAKSRRALKKKLVLARNQKIQRIMNHVRQHQKERELNAKQDKGAHDRTSYKTKDKSEAERPLEAKKQGWERRVNPHEKAEDWQSRAETMRMRLHGKREVALSLWGNR